ncbi:MAG: hypothetical protein Q8M83_01520 [bacterium]|nr:hypothetical protein [bacterium]
MKQKFLDSKEFEKNTLPDEKIIFGVEFPFPQITLPTEKRVYFAWHRNCSRLTMDTTAGTFYISRTDYKDNDILNYDVYSILRIKEKRILKIRKLEAREIDYHHHYGIPSILEKQAPKWVKNKIANIIKTIKQNGL